MARSPRLRAASRHGEFTADVKAWVEKTEARLTAVYRTSLQDLANEVRIPTSQGGNMPVVTGNLRRSLVASNGTMPSVTANSNFPDSSSQITGIIARTRPGDRFFLGFQAVYARPMERKYAFVRLASQRWPDIVKSAMVKVKERVQGRR